MEKFTVFSSKAVTLATALTSVPGMVAFVCSAEILMPTLVSLASSLCGRGALGFNGCSEHRTRASSKRARPLTQRPEPDRMPAP